MPDSRQERKTSMYLRPNLIVIGTTGSDTSKSLEQKAASPVRADASQKSRGGHVRVLSPLYRRSSRCYQNFAFAQQLS